jgi:preprotein translocase subunit SecF
LKQTLQSDGHITDESSLSSLSIIGPSIGDFMRRSAKRAIIVGLILMALYMMISFAGIRTVIPPYVLAIVTIVTMAFDVSIPAGAYGLLMQFNSTVQIDTVFIIAILTTMGYSINDTIIIFDRIRENIAKEEKSLLAGGALLGNVIETSLWQTMRRSLGTSISTLLVVVAMYFLGS